MLSIRDRGPDVRALQESLVSSGLEIAVDGVFGPATDTALRTFQARHNLVADGIAGPKTLDALAGNKNLRLLRQADIDQAAEALGVEVAAVMAINEVESRGNGFLPDGRPVILFERHIMRRQLNARGIDPGPWSDRYPNVVNTRPGGYEGGVVEWERLGEAWQIHPEAAIESASWGLFQIMAFHWERLGYASPTDFMDAMRDSEGRQLEAFTAFIKADEELHQALRLQDWPTVARLYNGPAYAKHNYHGRMQAAFDRHSAARETGT